MPSPTLTCVRAIVAKLVELAKGGNLAAIREILDRTLGRPHTGDASSTSPVNIVIAPDTHKVTRTMDLVHDRPQSVLDRLRLATP